jgi:hypothetical protein
MTIEINGGKCSASTLMAAPPAATTPIRRSSPMRQPGPVPSVAGADPSGQGCTTVRLAADGIDTGWLFLTTSPRPLARSPAPTAP